MAVKGYQLELSTPEALDAAARVPGGRVVDRLSRRTFARTLTAAAVAALSGCATRPLALPPTATPAPTPTAIPPAARGFVPILSYHAIRDWDADDTEQDRPYITPVATFEAQLHYLQAHGYHGVTTEQVYRYYADGRPLPDKPVLLSFDDNVGNHYTTARPLLARYGFTATFFIMTITLGKRGYMSAEQLQALDREGFDVQPHTWDHQTVTKYRTEDDWQVQLVEPKAQLEALLGHPTPYFAYPFGIYDAAAAAQVKAHGYRGAFCLFRIPGEEATDPLFAIPRYIVNSSWALDQFARALTGE